MAGQVVREETSVEAAVAPQGGLRTALVLPSANPAMMTLLLAHLWQTKASFFLLLQVDQAAGHRAKSLVIPDHIRLLYQPP